MRRARPSVSTIDTIQISATSTLTMTRSKQTARIRRERTPASASARMVCDGVAAVKLDMGKYLRGRPRSRPKDVGRGGPKSRAAWEQVVRYAVARSEEPRGPERDEDHEQRIDCNIAIIDRKGRRPAR